MLSYFDYGYQFFLMFWHKASDHSWIQAEADRKGCRIKTISYSWFWLYQGPFAGELQPRECRCWVVTTKDSRVAYVMIGPRRYRDFNQVLTWRWENYN